MRRLLDDPDIKCVDVDGCDFGMQTSDGVPIRKQWRIATSCPELALAPCVGARVATKQVTLTLGSTEALRP